MARTKSLSPTRPNLGIAAAYRRKLCALIEEMALSYQYWISAQYRETPPAMAQDATPARELERELKKLGKRWEDRFEDAAPKLARWFAQRAASRSQKRLQKILRDAGISVEFKMTKQVRDVLTATVAENVALIKSIPQEYHTKVQGLVMRSVTEGRDLKQLTRDLRKRYGVSERRAHFIALDQNNKATAAIQRTRQLDLGIEEGVWVHSLGGKEPRKTHLANNGKKFSVKDGWFDPDKRVRKRIWPGQLPRCRCVWRPVVKGFS
jgi:SPP1 gp7 family putative phage head morphogenesis protein